MTQVTGGAIDLGNPVLIDRWRQNIRSETFALYHYGMGVALRQSGALAEAAQALHRALDLRPDILPAYEVLRRTLLELGQPENAAEVARQATRLAPDFARRGPLEVALRHYEASQFDAATTILEELLSDHPDAAEAWGLLTAVWAVQRRFDAALSLAPRVGLMASDHGKVIAEELGRIATQIPAGTLEQGQAVAEVLARAAVRAAPTSQGVYQSFVQAHLASGRAAELAWGYQRLLTLDPGNAVNQWHFAAHRTDLVGKEADSLLDRGLRLEPEIGGPTVEPVYYTLTSHGRLTEAMRVADAARARAPECREYVYLAGMARHVAGRFDEALSCYESIHPKGPIDAMSIDVTALGMTGLALIATGRVAEASALLDKALAEKPDIELFLSCKAFVLQQLGRLDDAIALHRQALGLSPRSVWSLASLGLALDTAGDRPGALQVIRDAIDSQPRWIWLHARLKPWDSAQLEELLGLLGFTSSPHWVTTVR